MCITTTCCFAFQRLTPFCARTYATHSITIQTYSPAVASIIGRFSLSKDVVSTISPSGPKNRLLKGDVLAYLSNPTVASHKSVRVDSQFQPVAIQATVDDTPFYPIPVIHHSLHVNLSAVSDIHGLPSIQDAVASAVANALVEAPDVNAQFKLASNSAMVHPFERILLVRDSAIGQSSMIIPAGKKTTRAFLSRKFVDSKTSIEALNVFQLRDYIGSPNTETPTTPLSLSNTAILTVHIEKSTPFQSASTDNTSSDILDTLLDCNHCSPISTAIDGNALSYQTDDANQVTTVFKSNSSIFDELVGQLPTVCKVQPNSVLVFDLAVDGRAVSTKSARGFLTKLQNQLQA
ncbi:pyridoxine biosynthesis protein [Batrachochytrium dendrobatidis]